MSAKPRIAAIVVLVVLALGGAFLLVARHDRGRHPHGGREAAGVQPALPDLDAEARAGATASTCTCSARARTSSSSSRSRSRPTRATSAACCPCRPRRELEALKQRFPDLEPVEEGKTRINRVAGLLARLPRQPHAAPVRPARAAPAGRAGRGRRREAPDARHARRRRRQGPRRRHPRRAQDALPQLPLRDGGPMTIDYDQFPAVDMRVGRIVAVEDFPEARKPAWKLTIDFGEEIGTKRSSAQITNYTREELDGRRVVARRELPAAPDRPGPLRGARPRRLRRGGPRDPPGARHRRTPGLPDPLDGSGIGSGTRALFADRASRTIGGCRTRSPALFAALIACPRPLRRRPRAQAGTFDRDTTWAHTGLAAVPPRRQRPLERPRDARRRALPGRRPNPRRAGRGRALHRRR